MSMLQNLESFQDIGRKSSLSRYLSTSFGIKCFYNLNEGRQSSYISIMYSCEH